MKRADRIELRHVDLAAGLPDGVPPGDVSCDLVFWWRDVPLGAIEVRPADRPVTAARLAHLASRAVAPAVGDRLFATGFEQLPPERGARARASAPPALDGLLATRGLVPAAAAVVPRAPARDVERVSVVVCTRDRPTALTRCLRAIRALDAQPGEVIVVDNAPRDDATREVAEAAGVRYVREPRPGLSRARNAGIAHARGEIVAFTDDDATVHPSWLTRLVPPFAAPDVASVTGLVLPAALDHAGQVVFERGMGGFNRGFRCIRYDPDWFARTAASGAPVWKIGAGANMALRRRAVEASGGYDVRLGAGAAGCSEDSELWYRLLAGGATCVYEPAAVVFHHHREDIAAVRALARSYSRGHVAALFVQFARSRHRGNLVRAGFAIPRHYVRRFASDLYWRRGMSPTLTSEIRGYVDGLRYVPLAWRAAPSP